jgi:hypothetical protein
MERGIINDDFSFSNLGAAMGLNFRFGWHKLLETGRRNP